MYIDNKLFEMNKRELEFFVQTIRNIPTRYMNWKCFADIRKENIEITEGIELVWNENTKC